MTNVRCCPECGQTQKWYESPGCSSPLMPMGHWTHLTMEESIACRNLGDRNRTPGAEPDTVFDRLREMQ